MFRKRPFIFPFAAALLGVALFARLMAAPPAWWSDSATRILDPAAPSANYAPANLGQLKNAATQAKKHLDEKLAPVGGAGQAINSLVAGFQKTTPDNYAPVNLGQTKAVAKPFYDRLIALGVDTRAGLIAHDYPANWPHAYPWNPNDPVNKPAPPGQPVDKTANYAPANLGQLKITFSFNANQDTDTDGLPDWWETRYGLNPHDPADAFTMAPGGLSYLQKFLTGLNPTVADSDGDGVIDGLDFYPNDIRRSDPIPAKFYAVTDLSSYLPDSVKATFNATQVALDDNHNVAFFGTSDATSGGGKTGHVYRWQNGALTQPTGAMPPNFAMEYPSASGANYSATMSTSELWIFNEFDYGSNTGRAHSELRVNGINASATLATTTVTDYAGYSTNDNINYSFHGNGLLSKVTAWPLTSYPTPPGPVHYNSNSNDQWAGSTVTAVDNAGHTLGSETVFTSTYPNDLYFKNVGTYRFRRLYDGSEVPSLSDGSAVFPYGSFCFGLNGHGAFLAVGQVDDPSAPGGRRNDYKYYEGGSLHAAPDGIWQMNGDHQAIGRSYSAATGWRYWFGFKSPAGDWDTSLTLLDLLKWTNKPNGTRDDWDKYHTALRNVVPTLITDADPATAGVVIAQKTYPNGVPKYIYFNAEALEGGTGASGSSGTWTSREFCMETTEAGCYTLSRCTSLAASQTPGNNDLDAPLAAEAGGSRAVMPSNVNGTGKNAGVQRPARFEAEDIYLGFDPPIPGDRHTDNGPTDDDVPEWWAVAHPPIAGTKAATNLSNYPSFDLTFMKNTVVTVSHQSASDDNTFPSLAASQPTIQPGDGVLELKNGNAWQRTTTQHGSDAYAVTPRRMEIRAYSAPYGGSGDPTPQTIEMSLRNVDYQSKATGKAQGKLKMEVLPVRVIPIGFWALQDGAANTPNAVPAFYKTANTLLAKLNKAFWQARVVFVPAFSDVNGQPEFRTLTIGNFGTPRVGSPSVIELGMKDVDKQKAIRTTLYAQSSQMPKLHLVLVNHSSDKTVYGISNAMVDATKLRDVVFVQTEAFDAIQRRPTANQLYSSEIILEDFQSICIHEVGHSLGLSTRSPNAIAPFNNHDQGPGPYLHYNLDGTPVSWAQRWFSDSRNYFLGIGLLGIDLRWSAATNVPAGGRQWPVKQRLYWPLMCQAEESNVIIRVDTGAAIGTNQRSLWIRHEDWRVANNNAKKFEP